MNKHNRRVLIFSFLILFAIIVMIGAYGDMKSTPSLFSKTTYPFIFGACIILVFIFLICIYKESRVLDDKIEELAVKVRVHDLLKEIK